MKVFSVALALTALASSAPVDAQILSSRLPTPTTSHGSGIDGSWRAVGRDGNGNTIYERRTRDRNRNVLVQRAVRDGNGNMSTLNSRTGSNTSNRNRRNCDYNRTTNSVGAIIFGGSGNVNCDDKQLKKEQKKQEKEWKKEQKRREKEWKKEQKRQDKDWKKSQHGDGNGRSIVMRGDDRYYVGSNALARGNGKGKDHKNKH